MRKFYITLLYIGLILASLSIAASIIFKPWVAKVRTVKMSTQIKVYSGSVNVYQIDEYNKRIFIRSVSEGESTDVTVERRVYGDGGVFEFLSPLAIKFVDSVFVEAEKVLRGVSAGDHYAILKEIELQRLSEDAVLHKNIPLLDIRVEIHLDEIRGSAHLQRQMLNIPLTMSGVVSIDWRDKLFLELHEVKAGPVVVPDFVLRQLEEVFYNHSNSENSRMRILEINYLDGALEVSMRKF